MMESGEKMAVWDQRQAISKRLHQLTLFFNSSILNKDFEASYEALNLIFDEISPKLNDDQVKKTNDLKANVLTPLREYYRVVDQYNMTLKKGGKGLEYKKIDDVRKELDLYSKQLKKLQDEKGYGMPDSDDPSHSMID